MRHLKSGRKLKRTASHRKALLCNMAMSLFENKRIKTTEAKAKELRPFAEALITRAKHALQNEQNGTLPAGQTIDIHNRRQVARFIKQKKILEHLFIEIAPIIVNRNGGYLRITKLGQRRGDGGKIAVIEFVDFSNPQNGVAAKTRRKKAANPVAMVTANPTPVVSPPMDEPVVVEEVQQTIEASESVEAEAVLVEEVTSSGATSEPTAEEATPESSDTNETSAEEK